MISLKQILILAILYSSCSYGQIFTTNLVISNKDENDSWLTALEKQEKTEQIKMISDRLMADTLTYLIGSGDSIRLKPLIDSVKIDVHCRPQIILNQIPLYIKNDTPIKTIKELASLLRQADIDKVEVIRDEKATALYGTQGMCGLLLITSDDKRLKKQTKKLKL